MIARFYHLMIIQILAKTTDLNIATQYTLVKSCGHSANRSKICPKEASSRFQPVDREQYESHYSNHYEKLYLILLEQVPVLENLELLVSKITHVLDVALKWIIIFHALSNLKERKCYVVALMKRQG